MRVSHLEALGAKDIEQPDEAAPTMSWLACPALATIAGPGRVVAWRHPPAGTRQAEVCGGPRQICSALQAQVEDADQCVKEALKDRLGERGLGLE